MKPEDFLPAVDDGYTNLEARLRGWSAALGRNARRQQAQEDQDTATRDSKRSKRGHASRQRFDRHLIPQRRLTAAG
jgi:hypothetical protein